MLQKNGKEEAMSGKRRRKKRGREEGKTDKITLATDINCFPGTTDTTQPPHPSTHAYKHARKHTHTST